MTPRRTRWPVLIVVLSIAAAACAASSTPSDLPPSNTVPSSAGIPSAVTPSSAGAPSPVAVPSALPIASGGSSPTPGIFWTQVVGGADVLLMDVASFPGGVVAVGGARPVTRAPSPGLETSGPAGAGDCQSRHDAATCAGPMAWILAPDGSQQWVGPIGSEGGALQRVAWTGSSLVATGCLWQPESEAADCARPVVWTSPDGAAWTAATVPPTPEGLSGVVLRDVAGFGGEIVVAGCQTEPYGDVAGYFCSAAAVWRSSDGGATWAPPELPDGPGSNSQVLGLGTGESALVAGGYAEDAPGDRIWTSAGDGSWTSAEVEAAGEDGIARFVSAGGRWFAVGGTADVGVLWVSDDGKAWRRVAGMSGPRNLESAIGFDGGVVALGSADGIPVAWTTRYGEDWAKAATDFHLQDPELAAIGDRVVAVGREGAFMSDPITPGVDIR